MRRERKNGMDIFLVPNLDKAGTLACVEEVSSRLAAMGYCCWLQEGFRSQFGTLPVHFDSPEQILARCGLVVTIGGDGTILHAAKSAALQDKPVLGINTGRLGFLATLEMQQLSQLALLKTGEYQVEERMLLEVKRETPQGVDSRLALNDAVLSKGASRILDFDLYCQEHLVARYTADGVIISTPTGSTAYSLSAGGPIVSPQTEAMVMTPLCPHSLMARTMVFGGGETLTLRMNPCNKGEAHLEIDGETSIPVGQDDRISIGKAAAKVKLVNIGNRPFYEIVNQKIMKRDQIL